MLKVEKHDMLELEVLRHVEESPLLTNRRMADKLGVSVKLAHAILRGMVKRGLFHIKKHHSRRWDYFLTPKGLAEKVRLTREFLEFSMQFYQEARKASSQVCRDIAESGKRKIAFMGAGDLAEIAYLGVKEWNLELIEIYDDEKESFLGIPVKKLDRISTSSSDYIIVCLYDKSKPMAERYLPQNIRAMDNMRWIF
ncbi:MAG: hypothetical protein UT30_C0017G0002 [Candidatus Uhrbacteria bacterium GW2011_GWF2_39_13]|uniref:Winged helix-turn-helix transcriptional regulator n=1 Tax=Candidatus Uhrbacteria bacterium GW2011_GWF2_39_13 TaxID=1618995 RepID=A0A0G0ML28_9BACT|nr:MAG: hypothetical protein UT30_C0017G0002 [Candidatus Uhrbacteria bacterium GW2011_GWF2_39_13]